MIGPTGGPAVPSFSLPPGGHELADRDARALELLFAKAQELGFIGPGSVSDQITRSTAFATVAGSPPEGPVVDLGSGGGLPALVLALVWPGTAWLLIDSNRRRTTWLEEAVSALGVGSRVRVICERAETVGRSAHRHKAQLITARAFAAPAITAECSAPLLTLGGCLLVAEPPVVPGTSGRWPELGLSQLGLELGSTEVVVTGAGPVSFSKLFAVRECSDKYPRRVGVPFKRPLF